MTDGEPWVRAVGNELATRAPSSHVLRNWRLWWFAGALVGAAILLIITGITLAIWLNDWAFFGRFGAFISVVGSYLIARPVWRRRYKSRFASAVTHVQDGRFTDAQQAEYIMERVDEWSFFVGFIVATAGTIVWGFADLLNCIAGTMKCAVPF